MQTYNRFGFLLFVTILLFSSCKAKQYTFDSFEGRRIALGSSGGFSGQTIKYYIFENGQLFKAGKSGYEELAKLDEKLVQQQFDNYYTLGFDKMKINDAGNMSYFIIMNPDSHEVHMLKWGGGSVEPSKELKQYYKLLSAIIKKSGSGNSKPNNNITK